MAEKIVVSMTSYPARITNVSKSIFLLLCKQTMPPDEIHLWLSVEEFPNKEKDLPDDLCLLCSTNKHVFLHWLPKNTFVHKRHEIFKIVDDDTCVFLLDDDVKYDPELIRAVMFVHNQRKDMIVCYNVYNDHTYDGKRMIHKRSRLEGGPFVNKIRWCGQSMIPAKIYPKKVLTNEMQELRDKLDPVSDECWLQPFIVENDIPIYFLKFGWGTNIDPKIDMWKGIGYHTIKAEADGLSKKDKWLNAVLHAFPNILEKYRRLFNYER